MRALDRHLQRIAQFGRAADMVDMAVGQPDLLDGDAGLLDRLEDLRHVAAGVDHHGLLAGLVPDDGAVLLEQRHGDDDRAGLRLARIRLGVILLGHGAHNADFCCAAKQNSRGSACGTAAPAVTRPSQFACWFEPGRCFRVLSREDRFQGGFFDMAQGGENWWRDGIFYQIYPRSFQDSDGDGVGDLAGILQRLPYVKSLGVDAIWLSPIFPSPMADFGYDISDYTGIDPLFGTMADFDALLAAAHDNGLKLILDLVPNHTSDQHPWFVESRSSRDNPKRDWYIWRDPAARWRPAEQLAVRIRRQRLAVRRGDRSILLPRLPGPAAGPELAQSGGPRRDLRRDAVLAGQGRRRLSRRRDLAPDQGCRVSRQSAQPALCRGPAAERKDPDAIFHRPAGGVRRHRRDAARHRCIRRARADRRGLSAAASADGLLRQRSHRRADAVQFRAALDLLERALDRDRSSTITRRRCRRAPGRTGCSAITIARASPAASGPSRRGSPRCCC